MSFCIRSLVILVTVAACGGESEKNQENEKPQAMDGIEPGEPLTLREFCEKEEAISGAWQPWAERCCDPAALNAGEFPVPRACPACVDDCEARLQQRIDAGEVTYRPEFAQACLDERYADFPKPPAACGEVPAYFDNPPQARPERTLKACTLAFEGTAGEGERCQYSGCARGLWCNAEAKCQLPAKQGEACAEDPNCEAGLLCVGNRDADSYGGRCSKSLAAEGESCRNDSDCQSDLMCEFAKCTVRPKEGDACDDEYDCGGGFACDLANGKCAAEVLLEDGEACDSSYDCKSGWCNSGTCASFCQE